MEKSAKRVARRAQRLDPNAYQELRPSDEGGYREPEDDSDGEVGRDADLARPEEGSTHPDADERNPQSGEAP